MAVNLFARFATLCALAALACGLPSLEARGPDPICKQIEDIVSSASDVYYPGQLLRRFRVVAKSHPFPRRPDTLYPGDQALGVIEHPAREMCCRTWHTRGRRGNCKTRSSSFDIGLDR